MNHDPLWKEVLHEFLPDVMGLFFPDIARQIDWTRLRFMDQELFPDFTEGELRRADVVAEVQTLSGQDEFIIVDFEIESQRRSNFGYRLWEYRSLLRIRHKKPVLPLVLYLAPGAGGVTEEIYRESLLGRQIEEFRYLAIGLPDLQAADYATATTPVAGALRSLMKSGALSRPALKLDCLRQLVGTTRNDAHRALLSTVVESYLPLAGEEAEVFSSMVKQEQEVRTMVSVYEERGREQGVIQGKREALLQVLQAKFGSPSPDLRERVEALATREELERFFARVLQASTLQETGLIQ